MSCHDMLRVMGQCLYMQRACHQQRPTTTAAHHHPAMQSKACDQVQSAERVIAQAEGSKGLRAHLAQLAEEALPEFKRRRPKYFYYFQWMRERVEGSCGQLPGPVMDKLLTHDATELDMLCTFPDGIRRQARTAAGLPEMP